MSDPTLTTEAIIEAVAAVDARESGAADECAWAHVMTLRAAYLDLAQNATDRRGCDQCPECGADRNDGGDECWDCGSDEYPSEQTAPIDHNRAARGPGR